MRDLPNLEELARICGGEGRGKNEPRDLRRAYARVVRHLSIRITWLLLKLGARANPVTVAGILVGMAGASLLAWNRIAAQLAGLLLLQLSFVLDFCDGEIARYEREVEGRKSGAGGAYLDWVGHYYIPAWIMAALAWAAIDAGSSAALAVFALLAIFSLVRVPYSARDHIMWGIYRDHPELRSDPSMLRAALARMGGSPELIDLQAEPQERMAGTGGRGLLWRRYTGFGQLIVFPGFTNLVALAVVVDLIVSSGDPDQNAPARIGVIVALGLIHALHQLRAIAQGYAITRDLK